MLIPFFVDHCNRYVTYSLSFVYFWETTRYPSLLAVCECGPKGLQREYQLSCRYYLLLVYLMFSQLHINGECLWTWRNWMTERNRCTTLAFNGGTEEEPWAFQLNCPSAVLRIKPRSLRVERSCGYTAHASARKASTDDDQHGANTEEHS
jgi:hypothetical protein